MTNFTQSQLDTMVRDADTAAKQVIGDSPLADVCVHVKALAAEIERLTRELESANAIIQDERSLSHVRWLDAQTMRRERDKAREAARTILDSTEIADDNRIAVSRWPWLEEI